MGRKKSTLADVVLDVIVMLPWWAGAALAAVSYVVLHRLAVPVVVTEFRGGQIGSAAVHVMWASLASAGQYVLPFFFLLGAGISAWKQKKRRSLLAGISQAKGANGINDMSWHEFEMLVGEAFRMQGFAVSETGGTGADGGVDLVLTKGKEIFLVQCKQWKAYKVGVSVVRELYGVMAAKAATGGFVVTSGQFTSDAQDFAKGRNVRLIDGPRLLGLIEKAQESLAARHALSGQKNQASPPVHASADPHCPLCQSAMVRRTAKKGNSAGSPFWGCSNFPKCRGTRPIT